MSLTTFTGWQYLLIDAANHFGLDKELFETRIKWAEENLSQLDSAEFIEKADVKPLYIKAVMAIRKAQQGLPTGHLVGLDACCSGIQVMSALTGCYSGAKATGMIDPNVRADAYAQVTETMQLTLGLGFTVSRKHAKEALMTSFYGSKAKPIEIFGEDTPELNAFYEAAYTVAPGAWELLQDLLGSWQPFALKHSWKLPDGFDAVVKVMEKKEARIEVDELDHATFTYEFYENKGTRKGLSNVANVVHSVDAYILRSIHRRCNYDFAMVSNARVLMGSELRLREHHEGLAPEQGTKLAYYMEQYERSGMPDVVILPYITAGNIGQLSDDHLQSLYFITGQMLAHKSFEVVTIHDEFKCHANNMNHLRKHYVEIFAELAESKVLDDILSQLHGTPGTFNKLSPNLGYLIRQSNYALS